MSKSKESLEVTPENNWLSVFQVAERLRCSCKTVRLLITEDCLPASQMRRSYRILEADLNKYMKGKLV